MQLPETRRTVFLYISSFLQELLSHTQDNELDAKTLGKIILTYISVLFLIYYSTHIWNMNININTLKTLHYLYVQRHCLDQYF